MDYEKRRIPLKNGRRFPVTVTISQQDSDDLQKIVKNNRSAAIEQLLILWRAKKLTFADA
jgi:ATP-dependent protease HslVU (ClpYQ) ATPase subunit